MADQASGAVQVTCREYLGWRFGVGAPYLTFLIDLAGINAGRTLPKIPRTFVEAAVRMANLRRARRPVASRILGPDGRPARTP